MAALTQSRMTRTEYKSVATLPMNATFKATQGGIACVDTSTHYCTPAVAGNANLVRIGTFEETVDLSGAGAVAGQVLVKLDREVVLQWFDNSTSGAGAVSTTVGGGSLFTTVYMADDHTVTTTSGSNSVAGRVWDCNATNGVAVQNVGSTSL